MTFLFTKRNLKRVEEYNVNMIPKTKSGKITMSFQGLSVKKAVYNYNLCTLIHQYGVE